MAATAPTAALAAAAAKANGRKRAVMSSFFGENGRLVVLTSAVTAVLCSLAATHMNNISHNNMVSDCVWTHAWADG